MPGKNTPIILDAAALETIAVVSKIAMTARTMLVYAENDGANLLLVLNRARSAFARQSREWQDSREGKNVASFVAKIADSVTQFENVLETLKSRDALGGLESGRGEWNCECVSPAMEKCSRCGGK